MCQIRRTTELMQTKFKDDPEMGFAIAKAVNLYSPSYSMRIFVHQYLFRNVVTMLGDKEQAKQWVDDIDHYRIYGCFAMVISHIGFSFQMHGIHS